MDEQPYLESFFQAAAIGDLSGVCAVLDSGISVNAQSEDGRTALHWACQENQRAVVRELLERTAAIEIQDKLGFTPLAVAAGEGHDELIRNELLEFGADPNKKIAALEGGTALQCACAYGHVKVVAALLNDPRTQLLLRDDAGHDALFFARAGGHTEAARLLVLAGADSEPS